MKVLIIEENKDPVIKRIPNRLETLRKIVGNNNIEVVKYNDILLVFDNDAYKKLLPVNRQIEGLNIRGTFIVAGNDNKKQDFKDLTEEQIEKYCKVFEIEKSLEQEGEEIE